MKVVLSSQTYGPINPITNKHMRVSLMFAGNRGVLWAGDASCDRMAYGAARNTAVQFALKEFPQADGIMWIDSDIKPAADSVARLLDTVRRHGLDFVSGVYFQREGVHNPVFHGWNEDKHCFQPAEHYPPNTLGMAAGCGFGFVYTSLDMMRQVALSKNFSEKNGWFPDKRDVGGFGEDLTFCWMAKEAGFQLWIDTGVLVEHEANVQYIAEADFKREQEKWIRENKEPQELATWGLGSSTKET
jgi:hypothetical protein